MKKLISKLAKVTLIIMMIWIILSFAEIITKNVRPNPEYSNNNIIVNYVEWLDKCND